MAARGAYKIPSIYPLPPDLRLRQKIRVADAAKLNALSEDAFRQHFAHLILNIGPRLQAVELGDALNVGRPKEAAE